MAYIEARYDKNGIITHYRLVASAGYDFEGKQIRKYKAWHPDNLQISKRQMEMLALKAAFEFEESLNQGYQSEKHQTFAQYAAYVMELKKRNGLSPTTYERYESILKRINKEFGHIKLTDIRPQHLNTFYKKLSEIGVRDVKDRAIPKKVINRKIKALGLPKYKIAEACGFSQTTLNAILKGNPVEIKTAEGLADALDYDFDDLFTIKSNSKPLSSKTILEHHRLISSIFAQAEKELLIPYNPASKASPPKVKKHKADYFQPEEMEEIIEALEDAPLKWKAITYLLIDTGCRRGEVMGLEWKHINFEKGTLMIEQALLYTKERGVYVGPPKNGQPRAVCLSSESLEVLKDWRSEQRLINFRNKPIWHETGFIFTKDDGTCMHPDSITDWLNKFSDEKDLPHIHPHAFRHTVASTLIANGIDLVTTAAELGHCNATTTATIYAHQIARARAEAAGVRAGVFSTLRKAR